MGDDLPSYSELGQGKLPGGSHSFTPSGSKEFVVDTTKGDGTGWSLAVSADQTQQSSPMVYEGSPITGRVKMNLPQGDSIKEIKVIVRGIISTGALDEFTFLEESSIIWNSSTSKQASGSHSPKHKLQGEQSFPFSISLPSSIDVAFPGPKSYNETFRLPQTFSERHERCRVKYELEARLVRGKLKSDTKLASALYFVPQTKPSPASRSIQLAYQENRHPPSPAADPDGWHHVGVSPINGLVDGRRVDLDCSFYLAKPLCYTRGSTIPCSIILRSFDHNIQALDLLSSPQAIVFRLQRVIRYCTKPNLFGKQPQESIPWHENVSLTHSAVWWPSTDYSPEKETFERHISGELHLLSDMKPSTAMVNFRIEYTAMLLPFDILTFQTNDTAPLMKERIEIATAYADGPRPRAYAAPGFDSNNPVGGNAYQG